MRSLFHPSVKQSGVLDRLFGYYPSVCREPDIAVLKIGVRNAPIPCWKLGSATRRFRAENWGPQRADFVL